MLQCLQRMQWYLGEKVYARSSSIMLYRTLQGVDPLLVTGKPPAS